MTTRNIAILRLTAMLGASALVTVMTMAQTQDDSPNRRSPVQRGERDAPPSRRGGAGEPSGPARFPEEFRRIDGTGNNETHAWGAAGAELVRLAPTDYADGAQAPAGPNRPSARVISNAVAAQTTDLPNPLGLSDFMWQWGQFVDHDIDETPVTSPGEAFDIAVPAGDPWFDPEGNGDVTIPLDRSAYHVVGGVRQQLNNITAYIDASNVYGADEARALELRTLDGTGRMKTSAGDLLPFNVNGFDNAPTSQDPSYFLAGDVRANEQVALTAMHTLFVREHNHHAHHIRADHPDFTGDDVYDRARCVVAAEMQAITYREFLPHLLGPDAVPPYDGYRGNVDAGISNLFATAAYRVGHTMLSSQVLRLDAAGRAIDAGPLDLAEAFFAPDELIATGIDPLLRGLARQAAQDVDNAIIDDVRNFLFGPPGSGGFDLAALNIQRGRDHGLPGYNAVRTSVGLPRVMRFDEIHPDPDVHVKLASVYESVDDVDAWVGLLAEPHRPGGFVGETLFRILRDQFRRLRDGDRFWYQSYLPPHLVRMVEDQTLDVIIRRNTGIGMELQRDVFAAGVACAADIDTNGIVDFGDFLAVLSAWGVCEVCPEDITGDGFVDMRDVLALLAAWGPC